ncbi:MAG: zinc ribbon domain-containing protein [Clostridia bacterium]|nr:zinc ribbon domain-containing protein [Clostridia bacterium]
MRLSLIVAPYFSPNKANYTGYLFCGECGQKLYFHRSKSFPTERNFFQCGVYQTKGGQYCTAHYIREQVIDKIILKKLRDITAFARIKPQEFYDMATENGEIEAKRFYETAEKEKKWIESRIKELDNSREICTCIFYYKNMTNGVFVILFVFVYMPSQYQVNTLRKRAFVFFLFFILLSVYSLT